MRGDIPCARCGSYSCRGHDISEGWPAAHTALISPTLDDIKQAMREVRDERPSGWQAAAEACVAFVRYQMLTHAQGWDASGAERMERIAIQALKDVDNGA